jgi:hypothetical protein
MSEQSPLAAIRTTLASDREALRTAVDRVPAALREERPSPDRWSVAEIIEHLSIVESRSVAALTPQVAGVPAFDPQIPTTATPVQRAGVLDRTNRIVAPEPIRPTGQLDAAAAWTALESARHGLLSVLDAAEGRDLTRITRPHPVLGQMDGYQWIATISAHEARHTAQVHEVADALEHRTT